MKSGAKSGSGFRTRFWGPLILAHFPQAPKTVPFPGPNFGRRGTATTSLWSSLLSRKIWARIKNQYQMQSDNPDVASSSICSTAAKKQVHACCMYTLILTRCSNCGGPLCTTTFSKGLFGLVNEPAQPSKIEDHSVETTSTESCTVLQLLSIADASTMTGSSRLSCPGIVSGTTWCSIGQRREKGRVQQGGARHCRISVKIRRLLRKNTQTWVLSSVANLYTVCRQFAPSQSSVSKFSYCVPMCVCIL